MDYDGTHPCKSGLPFYSMTSNAMSPSLCYDYCTSKGMDIFAMVDDSECRCGVSAANRNVRHRAQESPILQFKVAALKPFDDAGVCPLRAYRYIGHLEGGGLPPSMVQATAGDVEYVDSVFAGHQVTTEEEDPKAERKHVKPTATDSGKLRDLQDGQVAHDDSGSVPWDRPCFPHNCAMGSGPWQDRLNDAPAGVNDAWSDYVIVPYAFDDGVDNARKEAFRVAVIRWHEGSCVVLKEVLPLHVAVPYIQVGIYDLNACWCQGAGYPGFWRGRPLTVKINLGWCNSFFHVGSMVHEIGHALGMNHEHKRPDAQAAIAGHGPYIVMHWDNVDESWRSQYQPDPTSYTGSNYQGPGDSHHGYAPYDYESIMHYPLTDAFDPVRGEDAALLGNREYLSQSDLGQINDMYQCKEKSMSTGIDKTCNFEEDSCNWRDVGAQGVNWVTAAHPGPATGAKNSVGYAWAQVSQPSEVFILQSPFLDIGMSYNLVFSYYIGSAAVDLAVESQDAVGSPHKLWNAEKKGNHSEWKVEAVRVSSAVAVRFVASMKQGNVEGASGGIGVDEVSMEAVDQSSGTDAGANSGANSVSDSGSDSSQTMPPPDKGFLHHALGWLKTIINTLFGEKYDNRRNRALRHQLQHSDASSWFALLAVMSLAALAVSVVRWRMTGPGRDGFIRALSAEAGE